MALSAKAENAIRTAMAVGDVADEVINALNASAGGQQTIVAIPTVTPTSGSLPTPNSATTIADTATPTAVELLDLIVELRTFVNAMRTALIAQGALKAP